MEIVVFLFPLLLCALGLFALIAIIGGYRRFRKRRNSPKSLSNSLPTNTCRCGYPLKGLDTLRCPECGCVIGFNATPEELGVTEEQLRRAMARKKSRSQIEG